MKLFTRIKKLFGETTACECGWRTAPSLKQLKYNAEFQVFHLELRADTAGGGLVYISFLYCPECGKRIAPLLPAELMLRDEEVTDAERERLAGLAAGLETYDKVFSKFGQPDLEIRSVRYDKLSPSASLSFHTGAGHEMRFFITPNWNRVKKGHQITPPNGGPAATPEADGGPHR